MKRAILIALTVLTLHLPAIAQDETPTPERTPIVTETPAPVEPTEPAPELETAFERIITLVNDVSFLPWAAALVLLLTQLTKRYIPVSPAVLALGFQVVIWAVYAVANHYGFGQNVQDYVAAITRIIEAILTVAPQMLLGAAVTKVGYDKLTKRSVPGFRPKPA